MRSRFAGAVAVIAGLLLLSGCVPGAVRPPQAQPPTGHPMGPGCTWPADLDPQRDGLAVLAVAAPEYTTDLVLLDVATAGVRARCTGLLVGGGVPAFQEGRRLSAGSPTTSVLLPTVSPDWQWALSAAGSVELTTGRLVPEPAPGWRAAALPGGGQVLRERVPPGGTPRQEDAYVAANWCLAPRVDAPEAECRPLSGDGPGFPAVRRDGSVGWAPAVPVPTRLDRLIGVVQTDGSRIVQLRLDPAWQDDGSVVDASGLAGLLGRNEFRGASGNIGFEEQPGWYTVEDIGPGGATARLHTGVSSWPEIERLDGDLVGTHTGAVVADGGRAVVVVLRTTESAVFVRVAEDAPARVVARLPLPPGDALLRGVPQIFAWPGSASSVEP